MPTPAETLDDVYKTVSPLPLIEADWFEAFYCKDVSRLRGEDVVSRMALGLRRAYRAAHYKALLMGHSGVGKSTEMTRLQQTVADKFRMLRLNVSTSLDPLSFQPFDVLLLTVIEVVEQTAKPIGEGGAGVAPDEGALRQFVDWFAKDEEVKKRTEEVSAEAAAGAGVSGDSWWAKALGLFGSLKGEFKYASVREQKSTTYRLSRLDSLIEAANALLTECNRLLWDATQREWLLVWEDFDKAGVSPRQCEEFFITYANVIKDLRGHFVFNIPIALGYSSKAAMLPVPTNQIFCIPDTAVFHQDHSPHQEGRKVVAEVLAARMNPGLFEEGQLERVVVASGGNLRNLFALTNEAADTALLRGGASIEKDDVSLAISKMRTSYERQLGANPFDLETVTGEKKEVIDYEKKAARLLQVYHQKDAAGVPDPVLYSLLRSRALQEFNGSRWLGVHPLVVDILVAHGKIPRNSDGKVPGGTE